MRLRRNDFESHRKLVPSLTCGYGKFFGIKKGLFNPDERKNPAIGSKRRIFNPAAASPVYAFWTVAKPPTGSSITLGTKVDPSNGTTVEVRGLEYAAINTNFCDDVPGVGPYEYYDGMKVPWDNHMIVFPYPSRELTKAAGALKQNPGY